MGACATKPKADATDAPAPLPEKDEVVKNELAVAGTVVETKEVDVDAADKTRSLSNLLKESEEVKGSTENDKTQPELVKEEACETKEDTDISETITTEVVKSEAVLETTSAPIVGAALEVKAEIPTEVEAATEKTEIPVEKAIPVDDVPAKVETEESTPVICAVAENDADKEIEVVSATEVQKPEAVEEEKIEEHDKAIETPISEPTEVESAGGETVVVEETASAPVEVKEDKKIEVASAIEETKIEEEKAVTTEEKTTESEVCAEKEKTTESEACAENVKP